MTYSKTKTRRAKTLAFFFFTISIFSSEILAKKNKSDCYAIGAESPVKISGYKIIYSEEGDLSVENMKSGKKCDLPVGFVKSVRKMSKPEILFAQSQGATASVGLYNLSDCSKIWEISGQSSRWKSNELHVSGSSTPDEIVCTTRKFTFDKSCRPIELTSKSCQ